jgi:hypothetical protein
MAAQTFLTDFPSMLRQAQSVVNDIGREAAAVRDGDVGGGSGGIDIGRTRTMNLRWSCRCFCEEGGGGGDSEGTKLLR